MSVFAIGDIQGCFRALENLLTKCGFDPTCDRLWFVGDLVNRGADSLSVLRFIKGLGEAAVSVLGNHDLHLIMVAEGFSRLHASDTLTPILEAPDRDELIHWLRHQPLFYVEDEYAMVHAGLLPSWTIAQARTLATEVESALRGPEYRTFLKTLYGNSPNKWEDTLVGAARSRVIVNAMTRMRICTPGGEMEFAFKGKPEEAPAGYMPWFKAENRLNQHHTLICGHWSQLGVHIEDKLIALDSGCLWGNKLTAVRLGDRQLWQISCHRASNPMHSQ